MLISKFNKCQSIQGYRMFANTNKIPLVSKTLFFFIILAYLPTIFFRYIGEEANYTIMSMEMFQHQEYWHVYALGGEGGRPPLYNWLMIPLSQLLGWSHVLIAARIITLGATFGTAWGLGWLARKLWPHTRSGWIASSLYLLTLDVLYYRGWLAYADPLFSFFMVWSMAYLWIACRQQSTTKVFWAMVFIFLSYLTKVFTAYVFLGSVWLILLLHKPYRTFLLKPSTIFVSLLGLSPWFGWMYWIGSHDSIQASWQLTDLTHKTTHFSGFLPYLRKLFQFPLSVMIGLLPSSGILLFDLWKNKNASHTLEQKLLLGMFAINFLPYWLAPDSAIRYVLPSYGFIVLGATYAILNSSIPSFYLHWSKLITGLGLINNFMLFPLYQHYVRGQNYEIMAQKIQAQYPHQTLFCTNYTSIGLSIVATLDGQNISAPAITTPTLHSIGIDIAETPHDVPGVPLPFLTVNDESTAIICLGQQCAPKASRF